MLGGKNQNVTYKGRSFHIQTEDQGTQTTTVSTHIFCAGHIIASKEYNYKDLLNQSNPSSLVRQYINQQHQQMINDLMAGAFDTKVAQKKSSHTPKSTLAMTGLTKTSTPTISVSLPHTIDPVANPQNNPTRIQTQVISKKHLMTQAPNQSHWKNRTVHLADESLKSIPPLDLNSMILSFQRTHPKLGEDS
jgi:hypothetical protein